MKHSLQLTLLFFLVSFVCFGQQGNNWFFGYGAGIDFNGGTPHVISGSLSTWEGCASISDENGDLLFYTNGLSVWNRNHQVMPNGYDLLGNNSSTQSSIIVPKPGSDHIFYIFTTDAYEDYHTKGFNYSVVDMSLDSGLGALTDKNIKLYSATTEKVTAIKHSNNKDFWVVSHEFNTNAYYAYLITSAGINPVPVITRVGAIHGPSNYTYDDIGVIRSSIDGKTLVSTLSGSNIVEIMNFNKDNGTISNLYSKPVGTYWAYGAEFSPDQSKLYVSDLKDLFQFNLLAGSHQDILNSMIKLPRTAGSAFIGQLSLAPDGKIYVAVDGTYYLGVVNNPNSAGIACNFSTEGLYLDSRFSGLGLPNFISSYNDTFCSTTLNLGEDRNLCLNESVVLQKNCNDCDYLWSDGSRNNSFKVDEPGLYWLEVSNDICTSRDSITFEAPLPLSANFDDDTTLCASQKLLLKVTQQGSSFLWSDGSTGAELEVSTSGDYWVDVFNGICHASKPVHVDFKDFVPLNLGTDAIVCSPGLLKLTVNENWGQILWSNNTNEKSLTIESTGTYWAEMSSDYCYARDSIHVEFKDSPTINIGGDIKLCLGETIMLDASFPFCNYLWSNSATTSTMEVSEPGFYSVVVTSPDSHCSSSAAVTVTYEECLDDLFIPNVITPNGDDKNDFFEISGAEGTHWDLIIYNRWGTQIFQSIDYSDDWNGNSHATGTYYYSLTSQYSGRNYMGWVELKK